MSEQAPTYHPAIEAVLVTEGDAIGDIKDPELAVKVQDTMDLNKEVQAGLIDSGHLTPDVAAERMKDLQRSLIIGHAARKAFENLGGKVGVYNPSDRGHRESIDAMRIEADYDTLQELAAAQAESDRHAA